MSEHGLHALIGDIYDAATSPELPMSILEDAARLTGSTTATFDIGVGGRFADGGVYGADPAGRVVANEFYDQNPFQRRRHLFRAGRAEVGRRFVSMQELVGTAFLHDFLIPMGTVHLLAAVFLSDDECLGTLSLWRGLNAEPHGGAETEIGHLLAAHLRRAFQFGLHFREASAHAHDMQSSINMLAAGCMLINARGKLIHANCEAMAMLRDGKALGLCQGKVAPTVPRNRLRWQTLLARLDPNEGPATGTAAMLEGPDASVVLHAVPLRPSHAEVWRVPLPSTPLGLVLMLQPDRKPRASKCLLRTAFNLTAAEADLAVALVGGDSLRDYGEVRKRSLNTVRTHLKAVFAKTGTSRQSDLVRLITNLTNVRLEH